MFVSKAELPLVGMNVHQGKFPPLTYTSSVLGIL